LWSARGKTSFFSIDRDPLPRCYFGEAPDLFYEKWEVLKVLLEAEIIRRNDPGTVHYAIFNPESLSIPDGYKLSPMEFFIKL